MPLPSVDIATGTLRRRSDDLGMSSLSMLVAVERHVYMFLHNRYVS
jgi:hypothetical protein